MRVRRIKYIRMLDRERRDDDHPNNSTSLLVDRIVRRDYVFVLHIHGTRVLRRWRLSVECRSPTVDYKG